MKLEIIYGTIEQQKGANLLFLRKKTATTCKYVNIYFNMLQNVSTL